MKHPDRLAAFFFFVSTASAIALLVVYIQHPDPQWEGVLLGVAFLAFGTALVIVARELLPKGPAINERERFGADREEAEEVEESFERINVLSRRRLLLTGAGASLLAFVGVAVWPLRSLGPRPGNALAKTPWRRGLRLVNEAGVPVRTTGDEPSPCGLHGRLFVAAVGGDVDRAVELARPGVDATVGASRRDDLHVAVDRHVDDPAFVVVDLAAD